METYNRDRFGYGDRGYRPGEEGEDRNRRYGADNYSTDRSRGRDIDPDMQRRFEAEYRERFDHDNRRDRNREPDWDRFRNYRSPDYDQQNRYGSAAGEQGDRRTYNEHYRHDQDRYTERQPRLADVRQGYGISDFDGTSDRYNTLNSDRREAGMQGGQYYGGSEYERSSSRYGSGMGDSFPNSSRGIPNYSTRTFANDYGYGTGSSYGGKNFGGGTGYMSGHRGGSFGDSSYGTSSGNLGGYGTMGSGTYGGRSGTGGDSAHNSNRGTNELGGF